MEHDLLRGKKIMVVEDDFSSRLYLNKILEKAGAVILNATNGAEAVDMAAANPDINIILMDLQLPVMDGFTSAGKIKKIHNEVKIIAQTAYGYSSEMDNLKEKGFDDVIYKPVYANQLINKLSSLIQ